MPVILKTNAATLSGAIALADSTIRFAGEDATLTAVDGLALVGGALAGAVSPAGA